MAKKIVILRDVNYTVIYYFSKSENPNRKFNYESMAVERMKEIFLQCLRHPNISTQSENKIILWMKTYGNLNITPENINRYRI